MIHELKCYPEFFEAVRNRSKTFEVRKFDRPFTVGDFLGLNEFSEDLGYTGRCMLVVVTYVLDDLRFSKEGYAILGITECRLRGPEGLYRQERDADGIQVYQRI